MPPKPVPTPLAAALGLVPTVLGGVRRLPGKVLQLPVLAISSALTTLDSTRRGYDDLAERGERLVARLRGTTFDEVEDKVEDALAGTPLAGPYDAVEDALEDGAAKAGRALRAVRTGPTTPSTAEAVAGPAAGTTARKAPAQRAGAGKDAGKDAAKGAAGAAKDAAKGAAGAAADAVAGTAERAGAAVADTAERAADAVASTAEDAAASTGRAADAAAGTVEKAADAAAGTAEKAADAAGEAAGKAATATDAAQSDERPEAEQPKGAPTPKATQPDDTRVGTAASAETVATVEQVAAASSGPVLDHSELPLPDYDHMTLGSLRGRMRSLSVEQLVQIRDYEKAHADRLPVVTMLENRIAKLANDASATPSAGTTAPPGELRESQTGAGGSKVTPAGQAESSTPQPHGVPGNSSPKR